jgi:hypothetical protein
MAYEGGLLDMLVYMHMLKLGSTPDKASPQ